MPLLHALAIAALAALLAFVGGCAKGKASATNETALLSAQVSNANASIDACAASLAAIQDQHAGEIAKRDEAIEAGMKAIEQVVRENLAIGDRVAESERRMAVARQEPTCRQQLEMELCEALPLY